MKPNGKQPHRKPSRPAHRFAMVIDLDRCTGCGACMVACAVENNVPPPHPKATPRTGLNWIRVFRIEAEGRTAFLPILCMQCEEDTPCQSVCPQKAVELDPLTGVVGQIPERCLGCRYCMAACPYQARVFNWADPQWPEAFTEVLNPMVSVRQRGTVEKCNFCHGRWHAAREKAAANGLPALDLADYQPACAEACPAQAITFGDLNDEEFRRHTEGAFTLLPTLHTGPKIFYHTSRPALRAAAEGRHA